jgi:hypothetical protein
MGNLQLMKSVRKLRKWKDSPNYRNAISAELKENI